MIVICTIIIMMMTMMMMTTTTTTTYVDFSGHTNRVQNGSGTHTASYPMGTRGSFTGGKAAGG
jgi:hypothetical protein